MWMCGERAGGRSLEMCQRCCLQDVLSFWQEGGNWQMPRQEQINYRTDILHNLINFFLEVKDWKIPFEMTGLKNLDQFLLNKLFQTWLFNINENCTTYQNFLSGHFLAKIFQNITNKTFILFESLSPLHFKVGMLKFYSANSFFSKILTRAGLL